MRHVAAIVLALTAPAFATAQDEPTQWPIPAQVRAALNADDHYRARSLLEGEIGRCQAAGDERACRLLWNTLRWVAAALGDTALQNLAATNEGPSSEPAIREGYEKAASGEWASFFIDRVYGLEGLGRYTEAEAIRRAELIKTREANGVFSERLASALVSLGQNLGRQRRVHEAIEVYREVIAICSAINCATEPDMDGSEYYAADQAADMLEQIGENGSAQLWRELQFEVASSRHGRRNALSSLLVNLHNQAKIREMRVPTEKLIADAKMNGVPGSRKLAKLQASLAMILYAERDFPAARISSREGMATAFKLIASIDPQSARKEHLELRKNFSNAVFINWALALGLPAK